MRLTVWIFWTGYKKHIFAQLSKNCSYSQKLNESFIENLPDKKDIKLSKNNLVSDIKMRNFEEMKKSSSICSMWLYFEDKNSLIFGSCNHGIFILLCWYSLSQESTLIIETFLTPPEAMPDWLWFKVVGMILGRRSNHQFDDAISVIEQAAEGSMWAYYAY